MKEAGVRQTGRGREGAPTMGQEMTGGQQRPFDKLRVTALENGVGKLAASVG